MSDIKKVVLAYSGGLDTSVILKWLQDNYNCEIVTFTADLGQGEELEPARAKAHQVRHQAGKHLHRRRARRIRARLRVPDVPRQHRLRRRVPAGHLDRASADRQAPDRDRQRNRRRRHLARRHRQGQRPGALRAGRLRAEAGRQDHRPVARVGPAVAREAAEVRGRRRHRDRHEAQERRRALLDGRQPAAHLLRRPPPGKPERGSRRIDVALDRVAGRGAGQGRVPGHRIRAAATSSA